MWVWRCDQWIETQYPIWNRKGGGLVVFRALPALQPLTSRYFAIDPNSLSGQGLKTQTSRLRLLSHPGIFIQVRILLSGLNFIMQRTKTQKFVFCHALHHVASLCWNLSSTHLLRNLWNGNVSTTKSIGQLLKQSIVEREHIHGSFHYVSIFN